MLIKICLMATLAVGAWAANLEALAQGAGKQSRLYVTEFEVGADPFKLELREALRARIEEGLAATKVFTIETRLPNEADALIDESAFVSRAAQKGIDLIIFPYVDSFTCFREARPITAMPGKYNNKAKCDAIMRVRVVSAKTDTLRTSFELDESLEKRLGVLDQVELVGQSYQVSDPNDAVANLYRYPVEMASGSREFVELAQLLSAALANSVYEDAYPPEVIEIVADQLFISRGSRGGFSVGDVLTVQSRTGKILYRPVTKQKIGEAAVRLGMVELIEAYDDYSVGIFDGDISAVQKGAVVRKPQG